MRAIGSCSCADRTKATSSGFTRQRGAIRLVSPTFSYFRYQAFQVQSPYTSLAQPMSAERILIVDDEDSIREVVSSMLVSANFICTQAQSGKEALALLQSGEEFERMLSDMMMPV